MGLDQSLEPLLKTLDLTSFISFQTEYDEWRRGKHTPQMNDIKALLRTYLPQFQTIHDNVVIACEHYAPVKKSFIESENRIAKQLGQFQITDSSKCGDIQSELNALINRLKNEVTNHHLDYVKLVSSFVGNREKVGKLFIKFEDSSR